MKLWWEKVNEISEDCKDLEWLFYNGGGKVYLGLDVVCSTARDSAPISEQIWAMRENLA